MRGRGLVVEQRAVRDRDRAGRRIDGEAAAGIVGQRIGERRAGIRIDAASPCRPTVPLAAFSATVPPDSVASVGASLTLVTFDGEGLVEGQAALVGDPHRDGVRGRGLVVEQRAVRDRDRAGRRVDGEAAAGIVGRANR